MSVPPYKVKVVFHKHFHQEHFHVTRQHKELVAYGERKKNAFTAQKRVVITTNMHKLPIQQINLCGGFRINP